MTKKFSLQTLEMAEAAIKDAPNFGLSAKIEQADGEINVAYDCCAAPCEKDAKVVCWVDILPALKDGDSHS